MKTWINRVAAAAATATVAVMSAAPAMAQEDAGTIMARMKGFMDDGAGLVSTVAFVLGIMVAIAGLLKLKAHSANPNDPSNSVKNAFVLMAVGAALVAVPALLGSGVASIFGSSATTTDATTGFNSLN